MSREKRQIAFFLVAMLIMLVGPKVLVFLGLVPPPKPRLPVPEQVVEKVEEGKKAVEKKEDAADKKGEVIAKVDDKDAKPAEKDQQAAKAEPEKPKGELKPKVRIALAEPAELVLGSLADRSSSGYQLQVQLEQKGAGVRWAASSRFGAEYKDGKPNKKPLMIIEDDAKDGPASFSLLWIAPEKSERPPAAPPDPDDEAETKVALENGQLAMDFQVWEVVRDAQGKAVKSVEKTDQAGAKIEGQELSFKLPVDELDLELIKTFRIWKGESGFEFDFAVSSPTKEQSIVYRLMGPHGVPIEGEWYTSTFRDVFFGQTKGSGVSIVSRTAAEVVKGSDVRQTVPLKFFGVEDQYFAVLLAPKVEKDPERFVDEVEAIVVHENVSEPQKADVSVSLLSKPFTVKANKPVVHGYTVFAGSKTEKALAPYGAEGLAIYRKGFTMWGAATFMATRLITPLLGHIYSFTEMVAKPFGGKSGNYGVAIILLTIVVRLLMFPISRKQAIAAKKMQDLQPRIAELKEKYGDDKEKLSKATFALYGEHRINPMAGCLPLLIQMPIFMGLWQALNNNVALRHAQFLPFFVRDLSAPDMLFKLPFDVPLLGTFIGRYFNLLPFIVMAVMMLQTKLFAPPAANAEAEMQQTMMKVMMVVMAFMFYKVPAGLGLYFITSSLWSIGERLLLPKLTASAVKPAADDGFGGADPSNREVDPSNGGSGRGTRTVGGNGQGSGGWLSQKLQKLLDEAAKDATIRNERKDDDSDKNKPRPKTRSGRR